MVIDRIEEARDATIKAILDITEDEGSEGVEAMLLLLFELGVAHGVCQVKERVQQNMDERLSKQSTIQ